MTTIFLLLLAADTLPPSAAGSDMTVPCVVGGCLSLGATGAVAGAMMGEGFCTDDPSCTGSAFLYGAMGAVLGATVGVVAGFVGASILDRSENAERMGAASGEPVAPRAGGALAPLPFSLCGAKPLSRRDSPEGRQRERKAPARGGQERAAPSPATALKVALR